MSPNFSTPTFTQIKICNKKGRTKKAFTQIRPLRPLALFHITWAPKFGHLNPLWTCLGLGQRQLIRFLPSAS